MKDFKGLVKISDVQNAFDEIIDSMNNIIDTYNASAKVLDIDYTKGSSELGASGYTLTVGGLKRVIQTYQGCSVGCKPFKIDNSHCKVTSGFVFANNTVYRANEQDMTGSGSVLYYDVTNRRFSFGKGSTSSTQSITIPAIRNSVSWGNIWATTDSSTAWQVPSLISSGNATMPYKGWSASAKLAGYGNQWKWVWNFPATTSCHIHCGFLDAFAYTSANPWSFDVLSGSYSNAKWTRDSSTSLLYLDIDISNASGIQIYGTFNKRSAYIEPFLGIFGMQLSNVTSTIITGGDEDAGQLVKICDLNWNRDIKQLATINKTMSESSSRSITIQPQGLAFKTNNGYTGDGDFCWATDGEYDGEVKLFGNQISYMSNIGGSRLHYFTIPTYLFIPKNVTNPLSGTVMNTYTAKYKG